MRAAWPGAEPPRRGDEGRERQALGAREGRDDTRRHGGREGPRRPRHEERAQQPRRREHEQRDVRAVEEAPDDRAAEHDQAARQQPLAPAPQAPAGVVGHPRRGRVEERAGPDRERDQPLAAEPRAVGGGQHPGVEEARGSRRRRVAGVVLERPALRHRPRVVRDQVEVDDLGDEARLRGVEHGGHEAGGHHGGRRRQQPLPSTVVAGQRSLHSAPRSYASGPWSHARAHP